jgi:hypothetical protein
MDLNEELFIIGYLPISLARFEEILWKKSGNTDACPFGAVHRT